MKKHLTVSQATDLVTVSICLRMVVLLGMVEIAWTRNANFAVSVSPNHRVSWHDRLFELRRIRWVLDPRWASGLAHSRMSPILNP